MDKRKRGINILPDMPETCMKNIPTKKPVIPGTIEVIRDTLTSSVRFFCRVLICNVSPAENIRRTMPRSEKYWRLNNWGKRFMPEGPAKIPAQIYIKSTGNFRISESGWAINTTIKR
jgi:hypothetical protein